MFLYCVVQNHTFDICVHAVFIYLTSDPADEEEYIFDTTLLQGYCSPKVQTNKLSINNLTHERLMAELEEREQNLVELMKEQSKKVQVLVSHVG